MRVELLRKDCPINKNCELDVDEFRKWQPAFLKHEMSWAISFSRGVVEGKVVGFSDADVWVRILFQDHYIIVIEFDS